MRLDLVTDTYPPDVNGVAHTLHRLRALLAEANHEVRVFLPDSLERDALAKGLLLPTEVKDPDIRLRAMPIPGYPGLRAGFPATGALVRAWQRRRPDVVYVATESMLGGSAVSAGRKLGIPLASGFHTQFDRYMEDYKLPMLRRIAGAYLRRLHNRTQATFAPSPDIVEDLRTQGYHNVKLLGRGVDNIRFSPARRDPALRREWGLPPDDGGTAALFVGRIAPEKNLPLAVAAFEAMAEVEKSAGRPFAAVMVGDGPKRVELQTTHPWIHFAGMRHDTDLARHYASADLFVFPSTTETFGNVILEALASGVPPLVFDYAAGLLHVRHGENGWKAPFGDSQAYLDLIPDALDPARWPRLRENATATASAIGWPAVAARFLADLEALASENLKQQAG